MDGTEFKNLLDRASNFSVKEQILYLEQARMQFWRDNLYWDRHGMYIGRGVTPHFYNRSYKDVRYEFRVQPLDNELERLRTLMPLTGEWVELNESGQLYWKAFFRLDTNEETSPEATQVNELQTFEPSPTDPLTMIQKALYFFYLQESDDLERFENMEGGKVKSIKRLCDEHRLGSSKNFEKNYNEISKSSNRLQPKQAQNIEAVIAKLTSDKAKTRADDELKTIRAKQ